MKRIGYGRLRVCTCGDVRQGKVGKGKHRANSGTHTGRFFCCCFFSFIRRGILLCVLEDWAAAIPNTCLCFGRWGRNKSGSEKVETLLPQMQHGTWGLQCISASADCSSGFNLRASQAYVTWKAQHFRESFACFFLLCSTKCHT